ncbi:AP-4 complex subunit beta-1-like [Oratosquilla oratoria]|uniref:AP-4 complex subunit beta-1-like n=1 Tax=Oratosquilla oratoria TaxID=337810 RepID=UPI003F772DC2
MVDWTVTFIVYILSMAPSTPERKKMLAKVVSGGVLATSEVVELLAAHDTLTKKLTCRYISHKCQAYTDLAYLASNLLLRDASDPNPAIRSVAVTTLATLPAVQEGAVRAVHAALADPAAKVRQAGALACVKLHNHAPDVVVENNLIDSLYEGIRDPNPAVITNCLLALDTILISEGGIVLNKNIAHYLYSRLPQFSECNIVFVLTLLLRYSPKNEEEVFTLLNTVDEMLQSTVPSVLVAVMKLFFHLTKDYPHLKKDMLETIQPGLCKILHKNIPEYTYFVLDYLKSLDSVICDVFAPHYKCFLVKTKDPSYLKIKKMEVLPLVSCEANAPSIIDELKLFCTDYQCYREAIGSLKEQAFASKEARTQCLSALVSLLAGPSERVQCAALECVLALDPQPPLSSGLQEAVAALVATPSFQQSNPALVLRTVGQLGVHLEVAPYCMEQLVHCMQQFDVPTQQLLITSTVRLFLGRPAECQMLLGHVLELGLKGDKREVAGRAAQVYAMLEEGPSCAKRLLSV